MLGTIGVAAALAAAYWFVAPQVESKLFKTAVRFTEVVSVSPAQASVQLTSAGYVVPQRLSHIAPKIPGKVAQVLVEQGQQVEPGQLLITLDPTDENADILAVKSRVLASQARAESAKAAVLTLQAELEEGRQQATRQERLAQEGVGAIGTAEDMRARVNSLDRRVSAARAEAAAAAADTRAQGAELEAMTTRLANLSLRSPIRGIVITKPPQAGDFVSPQPPGISVDMGSIQVADFDSLMVETDVPEQRLHMINVGSPAEIVLDAFPQRRLRGKTQEITPQVNRSKATVIVRVAFVDDKQGVLPDMAARVSFLTKPLDLEELKQPPKIVVPSAALAERDGGKVVFVVEDEVVRMVPVKLGAPFGSGFELVNGPRPGTRLVTSPPETMADGQRVKEKES
ncbi:MAG TPA: efflux RND transporter periplasmic adaptor subunit [Polyangiaceae bacterium]|nr:efflux RND transporter periplasmic adaptor subunit [Polyangiaceae bacterium]